MKELDRRERKKEKTRKVLLDVAIRLIGERGIYGTRVEDITERSDLGKGAFYNYFESKDRLVAELVRRGVELLHHEYLTELAALSSTDRIAAVIAGHEAFFSDHPVYVLLFHQARGLATMRSSETAALTAVFVEYLQRTGNMLVAPEDRDRITSSELLDLAAVIVGTIAGHRSFRIAANLGVSSTVVTEVLASGVAGALAARLGAHPA